jgi:hypothetical protein
MATFFDTNLFNADMINELAKRMPHYILFNAEFYGAFPRFADCEEFGFQAYIWESELICDPSHFVCDAIIRSDIAYCNQMLEPETGKPLPQYIKKSEEELDVMWETAVKYGRIEILNLLQKIDPRASPNNPEIRKEHAPLDEVLEPAHPIWRLARIHWKLSRSYGADVLKFCCMNANVVQWIGENTTMRQDCLIAMLFEMIAYSNIVGLEWIYSAFWRRHQIPGIRMDTVPLLQVIWQAERTYDDQNRVIVAMRRMPAVRKWALTKSWNREIKEALGRDPNSIVPYELTAV